MSDSQETSPPGQHSAGQRLQAARAAKAARKAAERGRDAELTEDRAIEQVAAARDWLQENVKAVLAIGGVLIAVAALVIGWSAFTGQKNTAAGGALWDALQEEEGQAAALGAVATEHAEGPAASWARLNQAKALLAEGRNEEARTAYEAVAKAGGGETLAWLALEGLAYTYEATDDKDGAIAQLDKLRALGPNIAPIADYHKGRLLLAQGKKEEAKKILSDALTVLNSPNPPPLPHTKSQIDARLALIDPGRARTPSFDPAQLQQLLEQQQQTP